MPVVSNDALFDETSYLNQQTKEYEEYQATQALIRKMMAEDEQEFIAESAMVSKPEKSKPQESQQLGNKMDDFHINYKVINDDLEGKQLC